MKIIRISLICFAIGLMSSGCATGSSGAHIFQAAKQKVELFSHRVQLTDDLPVRYPCSWSTFDKDNWELRKRFSPETIAWVEMTGVYTKALADWYERNPQVLKKGTVLEFTDVHKSSDWRVCCMIFLWPFRTEYSVEFHEFGCPERNYVLYQRELKDFEKLPWKVVDDNSLEQKSHEPAPNR